MTTTGRPTIFDADPKVTGTGFSINNMKFSNGAWHLAPEKAKNSYKGKAIVLAINIAAAVLLTPPFAATVTACTIGWYSLRNLDKPKDGKKPSLLRRFFASRPVAGAVTATALVFLTHVNHVNWFNENTLDLKKPATGSLLNAAFVSATKGGDNSFVLSDETPSGNAKTYNMTVNPQRLNTQGKPDAAGNWYRASAAFTPTSFAFRYGEKDLMVKDYLVPVPQDLQEFSVSSDVSAIKEIKATKHKRIVPAKLTGKGIT